MSKEAVFTMKLESQLRTDFLAEVAKEHRPASQVVRELMRAYIDERRQNKDYNEYLQSKVEAARTSMRAGLGRSNDDVEATFSAKRQQQELG